MSQKKTYKIIEVKGNGRTIIKRGMSYSSAYQYADACLYRIYERCISSVDPSPVECRGGIPNIDFIVEEE